MSVRAGLRATLVAAGLLAVAVTPAAAKPMVSVTMIEDSPCHFVVMYNWSNVGHGSDLTARIQLVGLEGLNITPLALSTTSPVSGQLGEASAEFTSTEAANYLYKAHVYLETSRGTVLARGDVYSDYASSQPETCS
jgi:hypothetical protein